MKSFRGVIIPVCWTGVNPKVQKDFEANKLLLKEAIDEGFTVTHITSSTVNNIMYVYHFLEKEEDK